MSDFSKGTDTRMTSAGLKITCWDLRNSVGAYLLKCGSFIGLFNTFKLLHHLATWDEQPKSVMYIKSVN